MYAHINLWWLLSLVYKQPQASIKPQENGLEFSVRIEGIPGPVCGIVLVHVQTYPWFKHE